MDGLMRSPLFEHVREYLTANDSGRDTTFLFAPYVKADVAGSLLEGVRNRVAIVTTWNPEDVRSGSSDLDLYPLCRERGYALYANRDLHLKVYSVGLEGAVLATGNVSRRGLLPGGNHEAAVLVGRLTPADRLFLEGLRRDAVLVDGGTHDALREWAEENRIEPRRAPALGEIAPAPGRDAFLVSALPMTRSMDDLAAGYAGISAGREPSEDRETAACVYHDLANYRIGGGPGRGGVPARAVGEVLRASLRQEDRGVRLARGVLWEDQGVDPGQLRRRAGPSRRELTGNVQVLLEWFEKLGGGRYEIDVPGSRSQRIRAMRR